MDFHWMEPLTVILSIAILAWSAFSMVTTKKKA